jgi:hypothetical protein
VDVWKERQGEHMKYYEQGLPMPGGSLIVGFDVEWTKNYQRKNANRAFCCSLTLHNFAEIIPITLSAHFLSSGM